MTPNSEALKKAATALGQACNKKEKDMKEVNTALETFNKDYVNIKAIGLDGNKVSVNLPRTYELFTYLEDKDNIHSKIINYLFYGLNHTWLNEIQVNIEKTSKDIPLPEFVLKYDLKIEGEKQAMFTTNGVYSASMINLQNRMIHIAKLPISDRDPCGYFQSSKNLANIMLIWIDALSQSQESWLEQYSQSKSIRECYQYDAMHHVYFTMVKCVYFDKTLKILWEKFSQSEEKSHKKVADTIEQIFKKMVPVIISQKQIHDAMVDQWHQQKQCASEDKKETDALKNTMGELREKAAEQNKGMGELLIQIDELKIEATKNRTELDRNISNLKQKITDITRQSKEKTSNLTDILSQKTEEIKKQKKIIEDLKSEQKQALLVQAKSTQSKEVKHEQRVQKLSKSVEVFEYKQSQHDNKVRELNALIAELRSDAEEHHDSKLALEKNVTDLTKREETSQKALVDEKSKIKKIKNNFEKRMEKVTKEKRRLQINAGELEVTVQGLRMFNYAGACNKYQLIGQYEFNMRHLIDQINRQHMETHKLRIQTQAIIANLQKERQQTEELSSKLIDLNKENRVLDESKKELEMKLQTVLQQLEEICNPEKCPANRIDKTVEEEGAVAVAVTDLFNTKRLKNEENAMLKNTCEKLKALLQCYRSDMKSDETQGGARAPSPTT